MTNSDDRYVDEPDDSVDRFDEVDGVDGVDGGETFGPLAQLLAAGVDDFGAPTAATAAPQYWPSIPADQLDDERDRLITWVSDLQQRFPEMVRLPPCWPRHNGLVEALSALRDHERASYAPTSPPTAAIAWQLAFHDIETRLRGWIAGLRCGGDPRWHEQP